MTKNEYIKKLKDLGACGEALEWSIKTDGTPQELWDKCEKGEWLLWLIEETCSHGSNKHRKLTLTSCKIRRTVLKYVQDGEDRPLKAIETREAWARGEASDGELHAASDAARAAAMAAAMAAASDAASDAARAAAMAAAMAAASDAASDAVWAAAMAAAQKQFADIVREDWPTIEEALRPD